MTSNRVFLTLPLVHISTGGKAIVLKLLGTELRAFFSSDFRSNGKCKCKNNIVGDSLILCLTLQYNEALTLISKETIHIPFACVYETGSAQLFGISNVTLEYPFFQLFCGSSRVEQSRRVCLFVVKKGRIICLCHKIVSNNRFLVR